MQFPLQRSSTYDGEIGRAMAQLEQAQTQTEQVRLAARLYANGGNAAFLYFTAGIPGPGSVEDHGLFGSIRPAQLEEANDDTNNKGDE